MGSPSAFSLRRNVRLFYLLTFVREFTPLLAIWVVYLTEFRHLTLAQVGLMEGLFWLVKLAVEVPSGVFADRFGRRASMIAGVLLEGTGLFFFAFASDFTLLTISYVVWGSGFAFRSGASEAYLYDALQTEGRGHEYTDRMGVFWALDLGGAVLGGVAGGVLAVAWGLQAAVLSTVVAYALALPLLIAMQEPPSTARREQRGYGAILREGLAVVGRDAALRNMVFLQVVLISGFAGFALLAQPFLGAHGVPLSLFGVLSSAVMLASAGTGLLSGRFVRALGIARTMVIALVGASGGLLMLAAFDHVAAFVGFAITAAAIGIVHPAAAAYVNERADSSVRATVLSLAPFGESIAVAIANTTAGVLGDASLRLAFAVLGVAIGGVGAIAFVAWRAADARSPRRAGAALGDP